MAGALQVLYKSSLIKNDETFFKRGILSGESFLLLSGSFEPIKWKRFPSFESSDYFYMSSDYWDAVMFIPKHDIYFLGFGLMNQYEKKPFKIIFKYNIDGTDSEEYSADLT